MCVSHPRRWTTGRVACRITFVAACMLLIPLSARAQSTIAGVVRDATGAVLPGVTGTAFNQNFGVDGLTWLRPTGVLTPRFLRFNVTFDF